MKENERWMSSGGLATSLASPGREARAFCSGRKVWGEEARGVQDRPAGAAAADRTVALVAKVPKSGRSCNTLRDSLEAALEKKKKERERSRETLRSVRKRNGAREEDEAYETRESPPKNGSPSNYVNKTFCSRFWECGRAGPPTEEKGYLPLSPQTRGLRSSFRLGFNSGLVAEAIDFSRDEVERSVRGYTFSIKKGTERKKGNGGRGRREEILPIWGKGQWTRRPCPDLTLRTDIIAWESAISRKQHSFFQDDFSRRAGGDDEMKRISRVARRTRRKDLVNNDRLMSPLLLSYACGGFHISDPSRK
ncbi:hypothetical protein G5I_06826 [Acromyrmex echinatior]|uniref:Uncharacterized protein n=1 Tax=Acromyrmex echinatior TaxID=103372 RepID=F4WLZ3_ACREC|nr:hypothetical protein G5I_06826 [Acromyrmex echinatior]